MIGQATSKAHTSHNEKLPVHWARFQTHVTQHGSQIFRLTRFRTAASHHDCRPLPNDSVRLDGAGALGRSVSGHVMMDLATHDPPYVSSTLKRWRQLYRNTTRFMDKSPRPNCLHLRSISVEYSPGCKSSVPYSPIKILFQFPSPLHSIPPVP